jgi:hypothetical protein
MRFDELVKMVMEDVQGMDTYWSTEDGKQKVTIKDVLEYMDDKNIPTKKVSIQKIKPILIDQDYKGAAKDRVERAELKYPIIVVKKNGKYKSILDGNHRAFKALKNKLDKIKVRELDLDAKETPKIFKELFGYEITPLEEQNIKDYSDVNWSIKSPTNMGQMTDSIMQGALIDWQMRNAGYSKDDIKKYWSMRKKGMKHEEILKTLRPVQSNQTPEMPQLEEININNDEGKKRAIKALSDKIGFNNPDVERLQTYLNLKDTMYSNLILGRHAINITFIK